MKKENIRREIQKMLHDLSDEEVERRSNHVIETITSFPEYKNAYTFMVFYPIRGEVNLLGMVRKVLGKKRVCFPTIIFETKQLEPFFITNMDTDFEIGPYNIPQPDRTKTQKVSTEEIDLVLVPGLAFDYQRYRLGRGGGFYDRFISRLNKSITTTLGCAFECQIFETLPVSIPQDQPLDFIATENRII